MRRIENIAVLYSNQETLPFLAGTSGYLSLCAIVPDACRRLFHKVDDTSQSAYPEIKGDVLGGMRWCLGIESSFTMHGSILIQDILMMQFWQ